MQIQLQGRVIRHIGDTAVVQIDGGMLPVRDQRRVLSPGAGAAVIITSLSSAAHCGALEACASFRVQQEGGIALLSSPCGGSAVPVLLSEPWPELVLVQVSAPSPEVDEGADTGPDPGPLPPR
jgi:hypothetical protein